jgi:hypothetical protein
VVGRDPMVGGPDVPARPERLARHEKADSAYLDLGVRLVDVAGRAAELYEKYGVLERRGFLASILQNVTLRTGS